MNNEKSWHSWSRNLWKTGEDRWIKRNGQDYYYRQQVVLPAIREKLSHLARIPSIIDLGCGDGYTLNELLDDQNIPFNDDICVAIIDISKKQLKIAKKLLEKKVRNLKVVKNDLNDESWTELIKGYEAPRIFMNIFVLQEMYSVHSFFSNISEVLEKDDLLLSIIVAPEFACNLSEREPKMAQIGKGANFVKDWDWAAKYPISTSPSTIYLPYFHRTMLDYKKIISKYDLRIVETKYLQVPDNQEARNIFKTTVYKEDIVGVNSSVLMCIKKK
ncbi:MAG: class I SAM-dependent methyltransferase [Planctomycetes bacterium]|nr:class I SAM-dependent methyltransferase [Planctomycetota bacterium]MBL7145080.1 class I SAM-dependent methyltransferase [Phycisphaerae bacterium]